MTLLHTKGADEREARLPRWARDLLRELRADVRVLGRDLVTLQGGEPEPTRITIEPSHSRFTTGLALPDLSRVRFRVGQSKCDFVSMYFDASHDGALTLMGGDSLIFQPWSSNVALLTTASIHDVMKAVQP
jgi:hypothetical protein